MEVACFVSVGVNESKLSFAHQKSKISGNVDKTLRVLFASRRNGVPADSSEIKRFPRHQKSAISGDVLRSAVRF